MQNYNLIALYAQLRTIEEKIHKLNQEDFTTDGLFKIRDLYRQRNEVTQQIRETDKPTIERMRYLEREERDNVVIQQALRLMNGEVLL